MRLSYRFLAAAVVMSALAACSDTTTAPSAATRSLSPVSGPAFNYGGDNRVLGLTNSDFVMTAKGGHVDLGLFSLDYPANAVSGNTQIHAVVQLTNGGLVVDFTPHVVFNSPVKLSTGIFAGLIRANSSYFARNPWALNSLALYYTPSLGATPIADFAADPSLITHVDLRTGIIWRNAYHFSGYLMGGGECTPSPQSPDCVEVDQ